MVRVRHPFGVATRETHTLSPVDFGTPSDRLYGSEMDIEAVSVLDLGQGSVTDGAISSEGLDGAVIKPGTLPPSAGDQTPPALPTLVTVTSELVTDSNGESVVAIKVTMLPPTDPDYAMTYVEATDINDEDPVTPAPIWLRPIVVVSGKEATVVYITGVRGVTQYWVRMRTVDTQGNSSAYSLTYLVMTVADTVAPPIPQGVDGAGGFKAIGIRWNAGSAADLMFNEVRFALSIDGVPDTANWQVRRTSGNYVYIDGLLGGTSYFAQVRAVDYSRNVVARWAMTGSAATDVFTCPFHVWANGDKVSLDEYTGGPELGLVETLFVVGVSGNDFGLSDTLGGAPIDFSTDVAGFMSVEPLDPSQPALSVDYLNEPESGWSAMVGPFEAALIGGSDLALNSLIANMISTGIIDASTIQTGHLVISTGEGSADGIIVKYGGAASDVVIGSWDEAGLRVASKVEDRAELDFVLIDNAYLGLWKDGIEQIAMTPDGLNASAINFGVHQGGHNLVFNSSFELSKFLQTVTDTVGSGGDTMLGGVGGWVLVSNVNGVLAAASITGTFP